MERKPHIKIEASAVQEKFRSRGRAQNADIPLQDRATHGEALASQYSYILKKDKERREAAGQPVTENIGIFIKVVSMPNCQLPLDRLDTNRDFKLRSCRKVGDREIAIVFIPESRRHVFEKKIDQYLDPEKDRKFPRNHTLIDSIAEISLADIKSFWTDHEDLFPKDPHQKVWWELWLKRRVGEENPLSIAEQLAERLGAKLGNTSLTFFDSVVVLIKTSAYQLERAPQLVSNLEELRYAKETPGFFVTSSPKEQHEWADELAARLVVVGQKNTSLAILDAGINYNHPLLKDVCSAQQSECWDSSWPHYDNYDNFLAPFNDHGSKQAGLAIFGDLHEALVSTSAIEINHKIESGRILPPSGNNNPELYGAITVGTAAKLEINAPWLSRVYSLAVTARSEKEGGLPSSWSAEIDQFTSGMEDGEKRLFIISAGNHRLILPNVDFWDQVQLAEIEDPAQSWNAITVGAYTEKTTNDDPIFSGWSPLAQSGDAAPSTRSAVNWGWKKQAPFKPDVVAEGGNRLLSADKKEVTNADTVSLLTTSGRTAGQLFEVAADTSAATALVSRQAAILMAEYPDYWPETIRGLLVHSAEWTPRMWERFELLKKEHSPKVSKTVMLRTVGHGVPNLERAKYSANNSLTLISQDGFQPFIKSQGDSDSADPKLNEMKLYQLPWPIDALQQLPPELEVKLRVTLSYFIEPNPGRRGYRQRYSYQSHGLRYSVIRPSQSLVNFRASINQYATEAADFYHGPEGDNDGWLLGPQLRTRGSLHSDTWVGPAASLASMHTLAVYPVGGWWKYRTSLDRWQNSVRYSLIVSIDVPDVDVDIYSAVENKIASQVPVST